MKSVIALVGRPNVGKSTLFNRLTKSRDALVDDMPGLTRDRHYGEVSFNKRQFLLVDTGGFEPLIEDGIMYSMAKQTEQAIAEADAVVFLVDGRGGITPQDKVIANKLRMSGKLVYVAVNKSEGFDKATAISDFYELGLENLFPISAGHGEGVHKLFTGLLANLPAPDMDPEENSDNDPRRITFAVVGRPNVGKSTLVNAILGEERVIAFDQAGTTRDSINIDFEQGEQAYRIIDTAGIRRRGKVSDKIEKFSVLKALQAISDANIVVLVVDAKLDIADQDANIIGYALEAGKSIVVAINKWDNLSQDERETIKDELKYKLRFLEFAKFCYISALRRKGIGELFKAINQAYNSAFIKLTTPKLTRILQEAVNRQPPSYKGNFRPKMRFAHQGGVNPPLVIIHGNRLDTVSRSYTKYLERAFCKVFNLVGTPLRIEYKVGDNPYDSDK